MVRLALRSALSDRADSKRIKVVDSWGIDEPKTARAVEVLDRLGLRPSGERIPRVLLVLDRSEHAVWKSFRNLGDHVQIVLPEELNAHDVLLNDWIVFSRATLDDGGCPLRAGKRRRHRRERDTVNRDPRSVIIRPVVSEKSYAQYDEQVYTFVVAPDANKIEIKQAVEEIFHVKVVNVNTLNRSGKRKQNRRTGTWGTRTGQKRAIVSLAPGDQIEIFGS